MSFNQYSYYFQKERNTILACLQIQDFLTIFSGVLFPEQASRCAYMGTRHTPSVSTFKHPSEMLS